MFSNPTNWLYLGSAVFSAAIGIGWAISSIVRAVKGTSRPDDL